MGTEMEKENRLLKIMLRIAAKYARDHVPAEIDFNYITCLVDAEKDPKGNKYFRQWLKMALKEMEEKDGS